MPQFIDLTGQRFGRLIVIKQTDKNQWKNICWLCRCDCGKEKIIRGGHLKSGNTKSCGCLAKEQLIKRFTKHGHSIKTQVSKIYTVWQSMIQRCVNSNDTAYYNYGERGITVCKRWRNSFENFLKDMGKPPEGYQIDKIDNNGNYCKENCRWSTPKENSRNRRDNHLITHDGKTQCVAEWAEEYDINYNTLYGRIFIRNWPIKKALITPVRKSKKRKN